MTEKIPTAEEFLKQFELGNTGKIDIEDAKEAIIEFAKLHVQEALKQASEKSLMKDVNEDCHYEDEEGNFPEIYFIDKDSILNAYGLNNIK
jgi:hypothetical protein